MKTLIYLGVSLNHVDGFLDFFDPPPPMWIILLNKGYVVMWIFREPLLPPWSSTWFKDPPNRDFMFVLKCIIFTVIV